MGTVFIKSHKIFVEHVRSLWGNNEGFKCTTRILKIDIELFSET